MRLQNGLIKYPNILYAVVIVCFFLIAYYSCIGNMIPNSVAHLENYNQEQVIHDLNDTMEVSQVFQSPYDFDYLTLSFSDHDLVINGETIVSVIDISSGDIIIQDVIPNSSIHYAVPEKIMFDEVGGGKREKNYEVRINSRNTETVGLGIYGYEVDDNTVPALFNGIEQEYSLSIGTHSYTNMYVYLVVSIVILSIIMVILIFLASRKQTWTDEKMFVLIALLCGTMMFLFLSLNSTNDGGYHYENSYRLANILLGVEASEDGQIYMRSDDAAIYQNLLHPYVGHLNRDFRSEMYRSVADFEWFSDARQYTVVDYVKIQQSTIWDRLPSVFALVIGRILHLGTYFTAWMAKGLSFLAYVLIVYYAIKKTPVAKMLITFVALLPRCIYSAVAITYDTMINAVALLIIALYLKMLLEELNRKEAISLFIASFLWGAYKGGIYLPILLIGAVVFGSANKKKVGLVFASWCIAGISTVLNYGGEILRYLGINFSTAAITESSISDAANSGQIVDAIPQSVNYSILYPLKEPTRYIAMLCKTAVEEADNYIANIVQGDPHLERVLPAVLIFTFLILMLYSTIAVNGDIMDVSLRLKVICGGVTLIEIIGIMTVFLTTTMQGEDTIWGVNGRYFIPILPLIFLVLCTGRIRYKDQMCKRNLYVYYGMAEALYFFFYFKDIYFI